MVLSDIQLEGEATGIDLAARLAPHMPLVLMTSLSPDHPLHQAALERAPVLLKPFEKADLEAFIHPQEVAAQ
jgi:hypothetical protein